MIFVLDHVASRDVITTLYYSAPQMQLLFKRIMAWNFQTKTIKKNKNKQIGSLKVSESNEKCLRVSSSVKRKSLSTPLSGREWATTANIRGERMNREIRILPLLSVNGLLGGRMSGQRSGQLLALRLGITMNESQVGQRLEYVERKLE